MHVLPVFGLQLVPILVISGDMNTGFTIGVSLAIAAMSTCLYHTELNVRDLRREHAKLLLELDEESNTINVLRAEWSYLNQPRRLQNLAGEHLSLVPAIASQVSSVSDIPFRNTNLNDRIPAVKGSPQKKQTIKGNGQDSLPLPARKPKFLRRLFLVASGGAPNG